MDCFNRSSIYPLAQEEYLSSSRSYAKIFNIAILQLIILLTSGVGHTCLCMISIQHPKMVAEKIFVC